MKGGAIKLKIVAKTMEKAIYKWRPARLLRFAELRMGAAQWTGWIWLLRVRSQGFRGGWELFGLGHFFLAPFFFCGYNSDSFIRLSVRKEVESDPREEN
jgi:hypothetical protein